MANLEGPLRQAALRAVQYRFVALFEMSCGLGRRQKAMFNYPTHQTRSIETFRRTI